MTERDDDFLSRWSRRKVDARDGGLQKKQTEPEHKPGRMRTGPPALKEQPAAAQAEAGANADAVQEAALKDQQPVTTVDEPAAQDAEESVEPGDYDDFDFDSLNYASDYTQFMKKGVPEAVRRRALRMLWQSNPILANIDGLNDYDEDFTDAATVVKAFASNYKVGSGYMSEQEIDASYSEEARKAGSEPADEEVADIDVEDLDVEDMGEDEDAPDEVRTTSAEPVQDTGDEEKPEQDDTA